MGTAQNTHSGSLFRPILTGIKKMRNFSDREKYMLAALRVVAFAGRNRTELMVYMSDRGIPCNKNEDLRVWVTRIAEDAIEYAHKN
jgi:hypothetical protein